MKNSDKHLKILMDDFEAAVNKRLEDLRNNRVESTGDLGASENLLSKDDLFVNHDNADGTEKHDEGNNNDGHGNNEDKHDNKDSSDVVNAGNRNDKDGKQHREDELDEEMEKIINMDIP